MAKVVYTEPRDVRNKESFTDPLAALEAQSSDLDGENWREEALDETVMASLVAHDQSIAVQTLTTAVVVASPGTGGFVDVLTSPGFTLEAREALRARFRIALPTATGGVGTTADFGLGDDTSVTIRIIAKPTAGADTVISEEMGVAMVNAAAADAPGGDASLACVAVLPPPGTDTAYDYVKGQILVVAGADGEARYNYGVLTVDLFKAGKVN